MVLELDILKPNSLKKDTLLHLLSEPTYKEDFIQLIQPKELVLRQNFEVETTMLKFLFFGSLSYDMTEFVIRDLGNAKYETFSEKNLTPLFKTRQEAEDKLWITLIYQQYKELTETQDPEYIFDWFSSQVKDLKEVSEVAQHRFHHMVLKVAALMEKSKLPKQALKIYQHTEKPPSRERQVRILQKLGEQDKALQLCLDIMEKPANADEKYFAQDFHNKLEDKSSKKATTLLMKSSRSIEVDRSFEHRVEHGALQYFLNRGYEGVFSENYLWRGIFGLLLWDIIFDEESGSIHHPLQRRPSDFYGKDFLENRKEKIEARLKSIRIKKSYHKIVEKHFSEKQDMANPMVYWHPDLLSHVKKCRELMTANQLKAVIWEMASNLRENTKGFPDLFIWKQKEYNFVEIKSPNDQLSPQQLFWQDFFREHGIKTEVLNVNWIDNPNQDKSNE